MAMDRATALGDRFEAVLAAAQAGAGWALETLYTQLQPPLVAYLRSQVGQDDEDVASQVWLEVARSLPRFSGDEHGFRRWVFTIGRRRVLDLHRSNRRRPADPTPEAVLDGHTGDGPVEEIVLERLGAEEVLAQLRAVLTPDQAEVVILRVVAGLDVDAVAAILGKRPGAVRTTQHRALRRLAKELRDEA